MNELTLGVLAIVTCVLLAGNFSMLRSTGVEDIAGPKVTPQWLPDKWGARDRGSQEGSVNPQTEIVREQSEQGAAQTAKPIYPIIKRGSDVLLSAIALVALSPVMALTAAAIRLDSEGPVLFRQERLGRDGRPFTMLKFRSMNVGAEAGGVYEAKGDSRVTRVGRILRRTSLDELPQLINIIRGEMSIVGPRPTLTYHPWPLEEYTSHQRRRFDVRPGVTGWAQVNGRKSLDWTDRIELDVQYAESLSPSLDIRILLRTLAKVLSMSDNVNTSVTARPANAAQAPEES